MKITLLVATVSQTAENIAHAIAFEYAHRYTLDVRLLDNSTTVQIFSPDQLWLLCSSTYDIGDIPENGAFFYQSFQTTPQDLTAINYGVIALGDSTYADTYAGGGKKLDAAMQDLGAHRIGELCLLDASSDEKPEEIALTWFANWLPLALATMNKTQQ